MKLTVTASKKCPVEGQNFTSQGYSCEIQIEPPQDVQQDREKLRTYVERLFAECRSRVEDQLGVTNQAPSNGDGQNGRTRGNGNVSHRDGHRNGNGHTNGHKSSQASMKQVAFLRALAAKSGLGFRGLQEMARTEFGADVQQLTKRQASEMIESLKGDEE